MRRYKYLLHTIVAASLFLPLAVTHARSIDGQVIVVHDGDTLTIRDGDNTQHRVRVAGIDAPEKAQAFGDAARAGLSHLTAGKRVETRCHKRDRFGRDICAVFVDTRDIGLEQIRHGLAWWYRDYAREQSPSERANYAAAEAAAREARRGLWQETNPTPPWGWRKRRTQNAVASMPPLKSAGL
jgi:endonuclease YncB( thermonuclease family)